MTNIIKEAHDYQVELFQLIGEFWGRATGVPPEEFSSIDTFGEAIQRKGPSIAYRCEDAYSFVDAELRRFYARNGLKAFGLAKRLAGTKLVLGGSSHFGTSHFSSTRNTALFADTVLIPDPLYPWLEDKRQHESFNLIRPLQEAHAILHLRQLAEAKLSNCPIFVFPSFEKSLERQDETTKQGIDRLTVDLLARFVDAGIESLEDAYAFAQTRTDDFLNAVERNMLFVPPQVDIGEPVAAALQKYDHYVKTWRAAEYVEAYERAPVGSRVLTGILERLGPQYHLLENAEELSAHPLLSIEQQGHYFKLVSELNADRLSKLGLLDPSTRRQLSALCSEQLEWLSEVPVSMLVTLREDAEHEIFRKTLAAALNNLHSSSLEDVDKVAGEICREINAGIARYNRSVREIDEKFRASTVQTAVGALGGGFGLLVPALAPFLGPIVPLAAITKFGYDAMTRNLELRKQSRSLMGVLAFAKNNADR